MFYGQKGKIGLIIPVLGPAPEWEFNRYAPDGIAILTQRIPLKEVTPDGLSILESHVVQAARILRDASPDLLVFGCTTGSLIRGAGYDKYLIERMQEASGIPSITTTTAVLEAFAALHCRRIGVVTPYSRTVNDVERKVLEQSGFLVSHLEGLGYINPKQMPETTIEVLEPLITRAAETDCDAIFISCTGMGIVPFLQRLEQTYRKPVVSSNQASLWCALRRLHQTDRLPLGKLFDF